VDHTRRGAALQRGLGGGGGRLPVRGVRPVAPSLWLLSAWSYLFPQLYVLQAWQLSFAEPCLFNEQANVTTDY
jgi:hypothetical protein